MSNEKLRSLSREEKQELVNLIFELTVVSYSWGYGDGKTGAPLAMATNNEIGNWTRKHLRNFGIDVSDAVGSYYGVVR